MYVDGGWGEMWDIECMLCEGVVLSAEYVMWGKYVMNIYPTYSNHSPSLMNSQFPCIMFSCKMDNQRRLREQPNLLIILIILNKTRHRTRS